MKSGAQMSLHFINIYCVPTVCQVLHGQQNKKRLPCAKPTSHNGCHLLDPNTKASDVLSILHNSGLSPQQP